MIKMIKTVELPLATILEMTEFIADGVPPDIQSGIARQILPHLSEHANHEVTWNSFKQSDIPVITISCANCEDETIVFHPVGTEINFVEGD